MYQVRWEIDVSACSPEDAAKSALACMRRPDTTATVFDVTAPDGTASRIDLGVQEDTGVIRTLLDALKQAQTRLNAIPHRSADTDLQLSERGMAMAKEPLRVLILLDGGLVQDVLTNRPDVEAAVLNQDVEGLFDEDISTLTGELGTLRGTLALKDTTVDPVSVAAAWRAEAH